MKREIVCVALAIAAMGMSSCRKRVAVEAQAQGPGMNAKREATLLNDAARELNCPREQLVPSFVESLEGNFNLYRVDGCGQVYEAFLHCVGLCNWRDTPNKVAAAALHCPKEQLTRTYLGNGAFTVSGCGNSVDYQYIRGRLVPVAPQIAPMVQPMQPMAPTGRQTPPPPPPPPAPPAR
jgi:hypothetical protein